MNIKDMTNKQRNEYRKKYNDESGKTAKENSEWRKKRKKAWQEKTDSAVTAEKSNSINKSKNVTDPYGFNKTAQNENNNVFLKKYGQNLSYSNFTSALNSVKAEKGLKLIKGSDTSDDDQEIEWLKSYSKNYGYKNKDFSNSYLSEVKNKIKEYENNGYQKQVEVGTDANGMPIRKWIDIDAKQAKNQFDDSPIRNKYQSEIDELKKEQADFEKKRATMYLEETFGGVRKSRDYNDKTKNVDYKKFFQGFDKVSKDRGMAISVDENNKDAWYNYVAKNDRSALASEMYTINLNALNDDEKNLLVYYIKKVGDKNIDDAIKNGKIAYDGTEQGKLAAEQGLKERETNRLFRFLRTLKNNEDFKERNEQENFNAEKNSSTLNKIFDTADRIALKPMGDVLSTVGSVVNKITDGKINTDSDFYKITKGINKNQSAISQSIKEKHGGVASFAYDLGINAADMLIQQGIGAAVSGAVAPANYATEMATAGKVFKNSTRAIIANSAYANTVVDAKDRGLSDNESLALGAVSAFAEVITEQYGLESIFKLMNKDVSKQLKKSIAKEVGKQMFFEGSEEVASDIINTIADIGITGNRSELLQSINDYKKQGFSDGKAVAKALGNTAIQYGQDFLAGALMGGVLGGVVTAKNTSEYNKAVKENNLAVSKIIVAANKDEEIIKTAKENGIKTDKYEAENKKLSECAKKALDGTDESANEYQAQFNKVVEEFNKIRNKVDKKVKTDSKATVSDSVFTDLVAKGYKTSEQEKSVADSNKVSGNKSGTVENENAKTAPFNVIADNKLTPSAFIDYARNGGEQLPQVQNQNAENLQAENGENVATDKSAVSSDVFTRLIGNKQSGYTTKMQADINEHSEDTHYVDNYKSLARVDEKGKVKVNGNTYTADEYSAEYNRIYDMGLDEETPTSEIKSKIFNPEQVRQIYAAAMVDDNIARYDGDMDYEQTLSELEENEAIDRFGNKTLANIMNATQNDIKQVSDKLGLNVEFCDKLPKYLNAPKGANGAYDRDTDTIYILNSDPHKMRTVFIHEVTHWLESTKGYNEFKKAVFKSKAFKKWLNTPTDVKQARYNSLEEYRKTKRKNYGNKGNEYIDQEIIATFVGDNIFSKDMSGLVDFVNEHEGSQRKGIIGFIKSIFEKFKNAIKGIDKLENKFLSLVNEKVNTTSEQNKTAERKFSVAGENAKTADRLKLSTAEQMEKDGVDSETIRKKTGWYKGGDGRWRFRIADNEMRFYYNNLSEEPITLGECIKHDKLFEAYPQLKDFTVRLAEIKGNLRGQFNGKEIILNSNLSPIQKKKTLIHEIQHYIQSIESFERGGNQKIGLCYAINDAYSEAIKQPEYKKLKTPDERIDFTFSLAEKRFNVKGIENVAIKAYRNLHGEVEARETSDLMNFNDEVLKYVEPNTSGKVVVNKNDELQKFIDNLQKMGYTEDEVKNVFGGVDNDESRGNGTVERGHSGTGYNRLHRFFSTSGLGTSRVEKTSKGTTGGNRRGISSGLQISNDEAGLNNNSAFSNGEQNSKFSVDDEVDNNYSYKKLTSKPDMKITKMGDVLDADLKRYNKDTKIFADDMVKIARMENNPKNTATATYLHNDDTNSDIMIAKTSFRHSAIRVDKSYINVSKNLSRILKNAIAVNELKPREKSNGTKVFIGMAEYSDNYVFVRMIVDNRTHSLNDYDILYAIKKSSIKKEEVGFKPTDYLANKGSDTSSTISISDLLENVKNINLVNSVLSKDVCRKLGVTRSDSVFKNSLKFAIDDEFIGPNGDYLGFDEDTDEVTYLSAENYQKELRKNPRKAVLDKKQIELRAKSLLNDFQSKADSTEVATELSKIFNKLKNSPGEWESVYPQVQGLAKNIYDNIAEQVSTGEIYDEIREKLKGSPMIWDDSLKKEYGSDWNNFIRKNRAKLNLVKANSNKGGIGIDVQYDILTRQFPGYFSGEAKGPKAQLEEILDVLNAQQYVYDTFNSDNESEIINDISSEIMSAYTQIDKIGAKTDKAKAQNEIRFGEDTYFDEDGNGIDEKRYKQDMRKQVNSTAADYIKEQKALFERGELSASGFAQRITDKLAKTSLNAKLKPLETYYKQKEKYRQRLEKVNRDISKNYGELKARAENPTEEKYIPKDLVGLVDNVIKMIEKPNFDAVVYLEQCKTALKNAQLDSDTRALYKDAVKNIEDQIATQGDLGTAFDRIASRYSALGNDKTGEQMFYCYHETVANKLQDVAEILKGTDVRNLTLRQNEALSDGLKCITTFVKDSCKAIGIEKAASAYEVADRMINETKSAGKHQSIIAKGINMELSPERMFRRLGGYAQNSAWEQMATMLTDGQTNAEFIKQRLKDKIAPVLEGENFKPAQAERSYKEKDLVDIGLVDENDNVVKIPRSFMLSAYMHLQAEANRNHALGGGFTVPNFRKYYKTGKQQQSFDEGTRVKFNNVKDSLEKMQTLLNDYEKTMLATTREFFNKHTKAEYNKISEEVFGFEKAKVKKYFPIYSNKDFVASEFDVSFNSSLENQGNMKARQQYATNPIMLFDIYDVINKETERCGEYCGKLKAEITFKRVYNTTMTGYETSIKEQVGKHFGESGKKYVEHLMQDYSGTRKTEKSVVLSRLRSAVATGALMGNINVAMKQAGSYPTAAATIGWKPLLKALATNDNGAVVFYRANREIIDKYTPWLRSRTEGYSTQEIADLKKSNIFNSEKTKWLFGWITASDVATVGRLWQASEYYIRDVRPELEQGTDEYYKEVAKIYNKVIFDTQPNYTVMQRPDILRNPNSLLKSMIMFSTQPLQNLGILYDAQANLNAQRKAFKLGTVDENTVKQAKREVAKGISSIIVSGITITAMTLLAKCITGKMDDYKDEYGNINLESILKGSAGVFNSTMAGMVTFGSDVYNFISSRVSDKKYYGISVSSIDIVYDAFKSLGNLVNSDSNTIIDNGKKFVEKAALMFGFPARNLKNLVNGIYNKITTDDWFAIESSKKPGQRYGEIYEAILSGDDEKYKEAYKNAIDSGISVNQIENGIKNILMADRQDDIIEAATAQNENDTKIYNDVVDDLVEAGFDENIVIGAIDTMVEKLNNDGLTDEQKKTKEKAKSDYMTELLKGVNYNGMNAKQKADTQNLIKNIAEEKAHEKVTKEAKNKKLQEAIKFDNAGVVNLVDYIAAEVFTNAKYADKNNDGKVDVQEKINAIDNADINSNAKTILKGRALMGSKKIDTDNDGAEDTKFSDLSPEKQEEYIFDHSSDIDTILEDKKANAEKSEKKAEYRKALESKVNVFDYSQSKREEVQKQIDSIASAQAGEEVNGDWEAKTVNNFIDFDNSGFIDISDYVKFKVYSKGYTKKAEQFEVINQLPGVDKKTKQKLKLYVAVRSKKFDADGDGKKEKYFTKFSSAWQEKYIKNNVGSIISNSKDWR